jgi:hypothetical protein
MHNPTESDENNNHSTMSTPIECNKIDNHWNVNFVKIFVATTSVANTLLLAPFLMDEVYIVIVLALIILSISLTIIYNAIRKKPRGKKFKQSLLSSPQLANKLLIVPSFVNWFLEEVKWEIFPMLGRIPPAYECVYIGIEAYCGYREWDTLRLCTLAFIIVGSFLISLLDVHGRMCLRIWSWDRRLQRIRQALYDEKFGEVEMLVVKEDIKRRYLDTSE